MNRAKPKLFSIIQWVLKKEVISTQSMMMQNTMLNWVLFHKTPEITISEAQSVYDSLPREVTKTLSRHDFHWNVCGDNLQ